MQEIFQEREEENKFEIDFELKIVLILKTDNENYYTKLNI